MIVKWETKNREGLTLAQLKVMVEKAEELGFADETSVACEVFLTLKSPAPVKALILKNADAQSDS